QGATPVAWTPDYAGQVLLDAEGAAGVLCEPVGPVLARTGQPRYGEFVCEVDTAGGPRHSIAIQPRSGTTFVILDPHKPRPAGSIHSAKARWSNRIIAINPTRHELELEDEGGWRLSGQTALLGGWHDGDRVTIDPGKFYKVVNLTRGQSLTGTFVGFGE